MAGGGPIHPPPRFVVFVSFGRHDANRKPLIGKMLDEMEQSLHKQKQLKFWKTNGTSIE